MAAEKGRKIQRWHWEGFWLLFCWCSNEERLKRLRRGTHKYEEETEIRVVSIESKNCWRLKGVLGVDTILILGCSWIDRFCYNWIDCCQMELDNEKTQMGLCLNQGWIKLQGRLQKWVELVLVLMCYLKLYGDGVGIQGFKCSWANESGVEVW